jgi:hypothetical protein
LLGSLSVIAIAIGLRHEHHQLQPGETLNSINSLHPHKTAHYLCPLAHTRLCF